MPSVSAPFLPCIPASFAACVLHRRVRSSGVIPRSRKPFHVPGSPCCRPAPAIPEVVLSAKAMAFFCNHASSSPFLWPRSRELDHMCAPQPDEVLRRHVALLQAVLRATQPLVQACTSNKRCQPLSMITGIFLHPCQQPGFLSLSCNPASLAACVLNRHVMSSGVMPCSRKPSHVPGSPKCCPAITTPEVTGASPSSLYRHHVCMGIAVFCCGNQQAGLSGLARGDASCAQGLQTNQILLNVGLACSAHHRIP